MNRKTLAFITLRVATFFLYKLIAANAGKGIDLKELWYAKVEGKPYAIAIDDEKGVVGVAAKCAYLFNS